MLNFIKKLFGKINSNSEEFDKFVKSEELAESAISEPSSVWLFPAPVGQVKETEAKEKKPAAKKTATKKPAAKKAPAKITAKKAPAKKAK